MDSIERTIRVVWQHRVLFTDHVFDPKNLLLRDTLAQGAAGETTKVLLVIDKTLADSQLDLPVAVSKYFAQHAGQIRLVCPALILAGGEQAKNSWEGVSEIHTLIEQHHIDRHSYVVAVGGGALLDVAGFAAATAHRGVRHVRIPSTTLSQCDSGVGVKNGINAFGKKNFVGTFAPPFAVINDFQLLATLSPRDKRAGFAEAVKVACIRDAAFFSELERDAALLREFDRTSLRRLIRRCAEIHVNHIADGGDPFESGSARPLDFGHWSAHKLEQLSSFRIRHGEAVAIGIALDVIYSRRMGYLEAASTERILRLLEALGFELFAPELEEAPGRLEPQLLQALEEFREHLGGRLTITLLRGIGSGFEVHDMSELCLADSLKELHGRHLQAAPAQQLVRA
ncbi:MAG TPA: 3-dehydroquinate synthase [Candidatus Limnocylindrales bacterium]|nr:3-dehydroquinate synthase [Candidatus Limnocylindrales bacterium]